jgi:anti-sigma B factor antagonist
MVTIARKRTPAAPGATGFSLSRQVEGTQGLVTATGELDVETAPRLRNAVMDTLEAGGRDLVVDLVAVTFLDSTALGVLVAGLKRARQDGGDLRLVATSSLVLRMLAITRLDSVFSVHPTVAAARSRS